MFVSCVYVAILKPKAWEIWLNHNLFS